MNEPTLSERERRILAEIEQELSSDQRLDRALRTMHFGLPRWAAGAGGALSRVPTLVLAVLLALSTALLLATAQVHTPVSLGLFALVWASALAAATARLPELLRRRRRRSGP